MTNVEPGQPDGIVGLFVNGESLFPHSHKNLPVTEESFPTAAALQRLVDFALAFGWDLRERVLVRNWDDPAVSSPNRLVVAHLQRQLFQLVHVPHHRTSRSHWAAPGPREREQDIIGPLGRLAANWALRTQEGAGSRPVTVVLAGVADESELPGEVVVRRIEIRQVTTGELAPEVLVGEPSYLDISQRLWRL